MLKSCTVFTDYIWHWFSRHKRTLPWRDVQIADHTERAYMALVSEVMLQQTQVSRVESIFKRFLREFPTILDLAKASNKDVIIAWRGMGYNSRALRLRDAAKIIVERFSGIFPRDMDALLSIKGIGPYTAAAVRNFAFHLPTPCIDTNIRRILHRFFVGADNADGTFSMKDKELLKIADDVLRVALASPLAQSHGYTTADWHAALMDFGSSVCTKSNIGCTLCSLPESAFGRAKPLKKVMKKKSKKQEPGRLVGSVFIPNRIFRGRIIEVLRDAHTGLTFDEIGAHITLDWSEELKPWLNSLLEKLEEEDFIRKTEMKYVLH